ncbi:hypothetical protein P3H80_32095 [Mycolicibacterium septicum]|uniref:hypothetical protein n=1 Tax=Mycolicibacterium septicum TaxID=98668 RepID=UPI0023E2C23B|nr:hypothetical protein [Mycolicibacterium septicum]MDF3342102.1 hypothetical protein [Mycolicibacterium septicum]
MIYQRKSRLAGDETAPQSFGGDSSQDSGAGVAAMHAALHRRFAAASRLEPLDCGCVPDPWLCRCTVPPLSDKMIDAGRDAALHVLESGRVPLLEIEVLQALWRRGGADRELAELLHKLTGGQVV